MYNKPLEYLLDNSPIKTISKVGILIRQAISPVLRLAIPLTLKTKLKIVRKEALPQTPVIFASTHGFKEDIEDAVLLADRQAFILIGSLSQVFKSFQGYTAWIAGTILVNRSDKESRKASKAKMILALQQGASIIIFPEGTWNKSPNLMMNGLFPGVYDVAKESGALVVPLATMRDGKYVYGIREKAFDITQYDRLEGVDILRQTLASMRWELMETIPPAKREDFPYGVEADHYWNSYINSLMSEVKYYDYEEELNTKYVDKNITSSKDAFEHLQKLIPSKANAFLFRKR